MATRTKGMEDSDERKEEVALCIILSVTAIEAFVNVYFRVVVSEPDFKQHLEKLTSDLKAHLPLGKKLEDWPKLMFGKGFDMTSVPGQKFKSLTKHRNTLIHFKSSHETISVPGATFHGLADTSAFDALHPKDAEHAVEVAETVIAELFKLRGIPEDQVPHMLHGWTGTPPMLR